MDEQMEAEAGREVPELSAREQTAPGNERPEWCQRLYRAWSMVPGFEGSCLHWWAWRSEPVLPFSLLIEGYDPDRTDPYDENSVQEMLTEAEVETLRAYLRLYGLEVQTQASELPISEVDRMGYGAIPVGGGQGHDELYARPDYPLKTWILGYYDQRPRG